ncbi:MAG TPA: XrtA/PEP-CTERM system TPR-repeat protein PrsT [Stellaceae bacterium]|nr:XrtA/PEP-CTERM system TPR-repeat protein PrsT [Stellaceae bacterium]
MEIMGKRRFGGPKIASALVVMLAVAACNKQSAGDYIRKAQTARAAGNMSAAIIDLKNALQLEPKNQTARLLLARYYLDMPDPTAAQGELLHAKQDGADAAAIAAPLAEADLMLGQAAEALKVSDLPDAAAPEPKADLLGMRAEALTALGRKVEALQALDAGVKTDPHSVIVLTAMVRYALASNDLDSARKHLAAAQKEDPKNATLFSLEGAIAFVTPDYAASEQAYQHMLASAPWSLTARIGLARAQIAQNKQKEADDNIATVLKAAPNNPLANYVAAIVAYREARYADAKTRIQRTLSVSSNFAPAILLAGASSYALKEYEQANNYLGQYVYLEPNNVEARKLLAATQVALGHSGDAVKTLLPAANKASADAQLLGMIGEASARNGDLAKAGQYLAEAVERQPNDPALRTQLGITRVALGQTDAGIDDLEHALQQNPASLPPETALFATYMRNKDFDKALEVGQRLIKARPKEPVGYDYAGLAELAKNDTDAARKALLTARDLKLGDPIASRALAALAIRDKDLPLANQYYQEILKANPKDVQAYVALAAIEQQAGHADQIQPTLEKAVAENPDNPAARLVLGRFFLLENKFENAFAAIQPALAKSPRDPALLEVAGRAELGAKKADSALGYFKTLAEVQPQAAAAHRYLGEAYMASGKIDLALDEAKAATALDAKDVPARVLLARLYMAKSDYPEAQKLVESLAAAAPKDPTIADLQGSVALAQKRPADAVTAYERGLAIVDNEFFRSRLASAEAQAGHLDQAEKTLLPWIEAHPDDSAARLTMGDIYVGGNRLSDAQTQYAAVLKKDPNNAVAENNLAWTLSETGHNADALVHAQHAAALLPQSPQILDTFGVVLMKNGKNDEAVATLQKAAGTQPDANLPIRLHLAQALVAAGRKDDARADLRAMLATGKSFKERDEAEKLLKQLGG